MENEFITEGLIENAVEELDLDALLRWALLFDVDNDFEMWLDDEYPEREEELRSAVLEAVLEEHKGDSPFDNKEVKQKLRGSSACTEEQVVLKLVGHFFSGTALVRFDTAKTSNVLMKDWMVFGAYNEEKMIAGINPGGVFGKVVSAVVSVHRLYENNYKEFDFEIPISEQQLKPK